jgi:hypothetical protein
LEGEGESAESAKVKEIFDAILNRKEVATNDAAA